MYSHVSLGTGDLDRAVAFYDAFLAPLGITRHVTLPELGAAGYGGQGGARPQFWVTRPYDGAPPAAGNGAMVAFDGRNRATVRAAHAAGLAAGGLDEGAPGLRPHYHPNWYGAYLRDLDGNKLCICCHGPE